MVYPPQCMGCGETVVTDGALCPLCWREAEFISGAACGLCGAPLPGADDGSGLRCDDCLRHARPWQSGRAVLTYRGTGRRLALMLKHGDRLDLAPKLGDWLAGVVTPLLLPGMVVAPVPLHPRRMMKRKYNQAALLAGYVARHHRLEFRPALLARSRHSPPQDHRSFEERFANQQGAITLRPQQLDAIAGRPVLLVDDVMASGATLAAAADSLLAQGAGPISVAVLARAVKDT